MNREQRMEDPQAIEGKCNSPKRQGPGLCRKPAGWGTPHSTGPCVDHGGKLPNVMRHHARLEALSFVRGQLGQEIDINPIDGALMAVRLAYGAVDYWRHQLSERPDEARRLYPEFAKAVSDAAHISVTAIRAGVEIEQVTRANQLGEHLAMLFERTVAAVEGLSDAQRLQAVSAYTREIALLEPGVVEGTVAA